ncbi:NAD(FAD)-dependent dehydrogenase [Rivularia sp. PCC 7116]|uniref:FAD-dependent oxidoreductase n=1 Tax=Rivularia sp. PCC 7116 TaxID=373994 RepID=UPI00029F2A57|nr:FAD-dependent oxidoreductase [Rivularia sp. PCC 7116]AFY55387.1 NAD(FAD)-dependent dehydrogenase [Rivularia sp. PCC 7116]
MVDLLIIGGSDAGISAALRAKELDQTVNVTIVVADSYPNFSICGIPFYLSGEVPDWRNLAHRTAGEITQTGINLLLNHKAVSIDSQQKKVKVVNEENQENWLTYDKLVIGTGAVPVQPAIDGLNQSGVFLLHSMADSFAVHQHLTSKKPQSVVIIGDGYIGLEMADALTHQGIKVTVVGRSPSVMRTVDAGIGNLIAAKLQSHQVEVASSVEVNAIQQQDGQLVVFGTNNFHKNADMVIVAVGVQPLTDLADSAGLKTGLRGAIQVNRKMGTNVPDIYAAGDCVETLHRLLNKYIYLPLGTTAHKQGRIAGENAVGGNREFAGSLGTQVVKIFDMAVSRTGLRDSEAKDAGFDPLTVEFETWDHKVYYPGAKKLHILVTGDKQTRKLLGAQIAGHYQGEVAKRIDIFATAIFHDMKVEDISELDLSYTPPLSSPWDPVQMAAQAWVKQLA